MLLVGICRCWPGGRGRGAGPVAVAAFPEALAMGVRRWRWLGHWPLKLVIPEATARTWRGGERVRRTRERSAGQGGGAHAGGRGRRGRGGV